jgi:hypothetical protein
MLETTQFSSLKPTNARMEHEDQVFAERALYMLLVSQTVRVRVREFSV